MPDVVAIIAHGDSVFAKQVNWRHTWQELSDYIYPVKSNIETLETPGEIRATERYDTTAEEAMLQFASGLVGWITPVGESWFRYEPQDKKASDTVKRWYKQCTEVATEALFASNFYLSFFEACIDGAIFGTFALFAEQSDSRVLNFVSWPIGTYAFTVNHEGEPDQIFRKFKLTARQMVQEWGEEKVGPQILKCYSEGGANAEKEFEIYHMIAPREKGKWKDGLVAPELRPIASIYVCRDTKHVIDEGGYYELPVAIARILKSNSEHYGRSPGMGILPEIKMLNQMELDLLIALEKMVNPPWLMPDDSDYVPDNRQNGITYYRAGSQNKPEQLTMNNRIDLGEQKSEQKRERIRRAFFNDMFHMLSSPEVLGKSNPPTATHVQLAAQERIILFTPIFARIIQEMLNPILQRVFGVLYRAGRFPEPPPEVLRDGGLYEITYISRIALAIKSLQNSQLQLAMQFIAGFMQVDPQARFLLNTRKAGKGALSNLSIPADWLTTDEEFDAMVQAEAEALQMQQAADMAQQGADALGKLPAGASQRLLK